MWTRIKESELVIRQSSLPARVVLERNSLPTEYRTHLEMIQKGGVKNLSRLKRTLSGGARDCYGASRHCDLAV